MEECVIPDDEFEKFYSQELELMKEKENEKSLMDDFLSSAEVNLPTQDTSDYSVAKRGNLESVRKRLLQDTVYDQETTRLSKRKKTFLPVVGYEIESTLLNDPDFSLIDRIVSHRNNAKNTSEVLLKTALSRSIQGNKKWSFHYRVPHGDFQSITTDVGKRIYLDIKEEDEFEEAVRKVGHLKDKISLLSQSYNELRMEAEKELLSMNSNIISLDETVDSSSDNCESVQSNEKELWVNKYKPRNYLDLLSDEATNRTVLHWIKLWDKVVFGVNFKLKKLNEKTDKTTKPKFHSKFKPEVVEEFDEMGRPIQKVVLLCGPPGLGKTTLAHIIASHAGYNVVEMNASDDRSSENFRTKLENATSMKSVFGTDKRPNCLIIDEIDGAPAPSINLLVNLLQAKNTKSTEKTKKKKEKLNLLRPIICICNDLYTPSLRTLRQISLIIQFPPTHSARLAQRLHLISRNQRMKTDLSVLLSLCNKTENDIRSCLSVLQFVRITSGELKFKDLEGISVGQKDYQRSLFNVWHEIFTLPRSKRNISPNPHDQKSRCGNLCDELTERPTVGKSEPTSLSSRFSNILKVVQSCGEYEKLTLGWFENYLLMKFKHTYLEPVNEALEWATMSDIFKRETFHSQSWGLSSYVSLSFVVYHFLFASNSWPKLQYPNQYNEHQSKVGKSNSLLEVMIGGMSLCTRLFAPKACLVLDILPFLNSVLQPTLRPVNVQLFSQKERLELAQVVDSMISYNLSYQQERTIEGSYTFTLDPNIEDITEFSGLPKFRSISYGIKQLIAREIEMEKVRRSEKYFAPRFQDTNTVIAAPVQKKTNLEKKEPNSALPNHLQALEAKKLGERQLKNIIAKDFFGRLITANEDTNGSKNILNTDVWYKFKEGYSNAVRRNVRIKTFFS